MERGNYESRQTNHTSPGPGRASKVCVMVKRTAHRRPEYTDSCQTNCTCPGYSRLISWQCAFIHCHLVLATCPVSACILTLTSTATARVGTVQGSLNVAPCPLSQANALFTRDLCREPSSLAKHFLKYNLVQETGTDRNTTAEHKGTNPRGCCGSGL